MLTVFLMVLSIIPAIALLPVSAVPPPPSDLVDGLQSIDNIWVVAAPNNNYQNEEIVMASGNLEIPVGVTLTLDTCTIRMNPSVSGQYTIFVNGTLDATDCLITTNQFSNYYNFMVSGTLILTTSTVFGANTLNIVGGSASATITGSEVIGWNGTDAPNGADGTPGNPGQTPPTPAGDGNHAITITGGANVDVTGSLVSGGRGGIGGNGGRGGVGISAVGGSGGGGSPGGSGGDGINCTASTLIVSNSDIYGGNGSKGGDGGVGGNSDGFPLFSGGSGGSASKAENGGSGIAVTSGSSLTIDSGSMIVGGSGGEGGSGGHGGSDINSSATGANGGMGGLAGFAGVGGAALNVSYSSFVIDNAVLIGGDGGKGGDGGAGGNITYAHSNVDFLQGGLPGIGFGGEAAGPGIYTVGTTTETAYITNTNITGGKGGTGGTGGDGGDTGGAAPLPTNGNQGTQAGVGGHGVEVSGYTMTIMSSYLTGGEGGDGGTGGKGAGILSALSPNRNGGFGGAGGSGAIGGSGYKGNQITVFTAMATVNFTGGLGGYGGMGGMGGDVNRSLPTGIGGDGGDGWDGGTGGLGFYSSPDGGNISIVNSNFTGGEGGKGRVGGIGGDGPTKGFQGSSAASKAGGAGMDVMMRGTTIYLSGVNMSGGKGGDFVIQDTMANPMMSGNGGNGLILRGDDQATATVVLSNFTGGNGGSYFNGLGAFGTGADGGYGVQASGDENPVPPNLPSTLASWFDRCNIYYGQGGSYNSTIGITGFDRGPVHTYGSGFLSNGATFDNCTLYTTNTGRSDPPFTSSNQGIAIALNSTFDRSVPSFLNGGEVDVRYYLSVLVQDPFFQPLQGALVTVNDTFIFPPTIAVRLTEADGYARWIAATLYTEPPGSFLTHNINVSAAKSPYKTGLGPEFVFVDQGKEITINLTMNMPPTTPLWLSPTSTHNQLDFLFTYTPSTDPENDDILYHFNIWLGNDTSGTQVLFDGTYPEISLIPPATIPLVGPFGLGVWPGPLTHYQWYHVEWYADDGNGGLSGINTFNFTCNNTAPTAPGLSIFPTPPAQPLTFDDIQCLVSTPSTDSDTNPMDTIVYTYKWWKRTPLAPTWVMIREVINTTDTVDLLPSAFTTRSEDWRCDVWPSDQITVGPGTSSQIVTVGNTAPEINDSLPTSRMPDVVFDEGASVLNAFDLDDHFIDDDLDTLFYVTHSGDTYIDVTIWPNKQVDFQVDSNYPNWAGVETITFNISDGPVSDLDRLYVEDSMIVTVNPVNDPPTLDPIPDVYADEDVWRVITFINAFDVDGDTVMFTHNIDTQILNLALGTNYTFNSQTGQVGFLFDNSNSGNIYQITINVSDQNMTGGPLFAERTFTITVNNTNDPPTAEIQSPINNTRIPEADNLVDFLGSGDDPDLYVPGVTEQLDFTWTTNHSAHSTALGTGTSLSGIEMAVGFHMVTLTVSDGDLEAYAYVYLEINATPPPPPPPPPPTQPNVTYIEPNDGFETEEILPRYGFRSCDHGFQYYGHHGGEGACSWHLLLEGDPVRWRLRRRDT